MWPVYLVHTILIHLIARINLPHSQSDTTAIRYVYPVIASAARNGSSPNCTGGRVLCTLETSARFLDTLGAE